MLFLIESTPPGYLDKYLPILTPIAVIIAFLLQKVDSIRVKNTLAQQNELGHGSRQKLNTIHDLVNGSMSEQKRLTMMFARRIADLTKTPADEAIAKQAEKAFMVHQEKIDQPTEKGAWSNVTANTMTTDKP
jgi:hypothetical protein